MGLNADLVDVEADAEHSVDIVSSELGFTIRNERE